MPMISIFIIKIIRLLNINRYGTLAAACVLYEYINTFCKPYLQYHISKKECVEKMKSLYKYKPIFANRYGFIQSYLQLYRRVDKLDRRSYHLKAPFDGEIVLDVIENNSKKNVLLVHGFNGSSRSRYIVGLSGYFDKERYRVFCFNARGTKYTLKNEIFFHIGWTVDIKVAVDYILENYEGTLEIYGFSMGAAWVTKYLGEKVHDDRITKAGAICLPFNFYNIERSIGKTYVSRLLAYNYGKYIRRNKEIFERAGLDLAKMLKCKSLRDIDTLLTKKVFSIQDMDEYYKNESCSNFLKNINIPFLILNTKDDPIIPEEVIDKDECRKNRNILLVINPWGGHLGFLKKFIIGSIADDIIIDFSKHFF